MHLFVFLKLPRQKISLTSPRITVIEFCDQPEKALSSFRVFMSDHYFEKDYGLEDYKHYNKPIYPPEKLGSFQLKEPTSYTTFFLWDKNFLI